VALYLDTSCLLKTLFPEPETARVLKLCAAEPRVIVSTLAKLEASVQIAARVAGGTLSRSGAERLLRRLDAMMALAPYEVAIFPPAAVDIAEKQVRLNRRAVHCRTLDRLHLAVMQVLGLRKILTNDGAQATAAAALGFEVVVPR
jgi:predicted nucleic acid-binding protein